VPAIGLRWILPEPGSRGQRILLAGTYGAAVTTDGRTFRQLAPPGLGRIYTAALAREGVWLLTERQLVRVSWEGEELEFVGMPDWFGTGYGSTAVIAHPEDRYVLVSANSRGGSGAAVVIARLDREAGTWRILHEARTLGAADPMRDAFMPLNFVPGQPPSMYLRITGQKAYRIDTEKWTVSLSPYLGSADHGMLSYQLWPGGLRTDHNLMGCGALVSVLRTGEHFIAAGAALVVLRPEEDDPPTILPIGERLGHVQQTAYGTWCVGNKDKYTGIFEIHVRPQAEGK